MKTRDEGDIKYKEKNGESKTKIKVGIKRNKKGALLS